MLEGLYRIALAVPQVKVADPEGNVDSILSLIRSGMVTIPMLLLGVPFLGLLGIQIAQPTADIIAGLISIPFIIQFVRKPE